MNLFLRVASALVLLPVVLALAHQGGWYFYGFCAVASVMTLLEYGGIVAKEDSPARLFFVVVGTLVVLLGMRVQDPVLVLLLVQTGAIALTIFFTFRTGDMATVWPRLGALAFGLLYVGLAIVSVYRLRVFGDAYGSEWARPTWLYVALIATWSNDTFAYFAGRAFGKHKLYEKVSPKKTWEGFAGGAAGSLGMLYVFRALFPEAFGHFTTVDLLFIGLPAAALAPAGDLAESLLKRTYGVKDSGHTIPGHGGMLDRVDAVFFVVPWVLLYATGLKPLLESL
jgi:phosphatidate cytidylyltransferase